MPGIGDNGGIVGPKNAPSLSGTSGIWYPNEVQRARESSLWPGPTYACEFLVVAGGGAGVGVLQSGGGGAGGRARACAGATGRSGGATRGATKSPAKGISSTVSSKTSFASGSIAAEEAPPIIMGRGVGAVMRPCLAAADRALRIGGPKTVPKIGAIACAGTVPPKEFQSFPSKLPIAAPLFDLFCVRLAILPVTLAKEVIIPCSSLVKSTSTTP